MFTKQRSELSAAINNLAAKYGTNNPELLKDLLDLQKKLERPGIKPLEYASYAVQIARVVEWIFDHLPPPH
jgi:hypothetical protein